MSFRPVKLTICGILGCSWRTLVTKFYEKYLEHHTQFRSLSTDVDIETVLCSILLGMGVNALIAEVQVKKSEYELFTSTCQSCFSKPIKVIQNPSNHTMFSCNRVVLVEDDNKYYVILVARGLVFPVEIEFLITATLFNDTSFYKVEHKKLVPNDSTPLLDLVSMAFQDICKLKKQVGLFLFSETFKRKVISYETYTLELFTNHRKGLRHRLRKICEVGSLCKEILCEYVALKSKLTSISILPDRNRLQASYEIGAPHCLTSRITEYGVEQISYFSSNQPMDITKLTENFLVVSQGVEVPIYTGGMLYSIVTGQQRQGSLDVTNLFIQQNKHNQQGTLKDLDLQSLLVREPFHIRYPFEVRGSLFKCIARSLTSTILNPRIKNEDMNELKTILQQLTSCAVFCDLDPAKVQKNSDLVYLRTTKKDSEEEDSNKVLSMAEGCALIMNSQIGHGHLRSSRERFLQLRSTLLEDYKAQLLSRIELVEGKISDSEQIESEVAKRWLIQAESLSLEKFKALEALLRRGIA